MPELACRAALCYNLSRNIVGTKGAENTPRLANLCRRLAMDMIPQDNAPYKQCTGPCGRFLPATPEYFHRSKGDLHPQCKDCKCAYHKRPEVRARQSENRKRRRQENRLREAIPVTDIPTEKRCRGGCKRVLPATIEFFYRDKGTKDGLHSACKDCALQATKTYQAKPEVRTHRQAYKQEYRSRPEVQEHERAYNNAYWSRPDVNARKRAYDKVRRSSPEFREKERLSYRAYLQRPEIRERHNAWRRANSRRRREHLSAKQRVYQQRPEVRTRRNARLQTWRKSYFNQPGVRERYRTHWRNRHAIQSAIPGKHTPEQIAEQLKRQHYRCYYAACGHAEFEKRNGKYVYHVDHTFPISRIASTDIPANDISYLVLACPSCNAKKGDKFPWEWPEGGRLL